MDAGDLRGQVGTVAGVPLKAGAPDDPGVFTHLPVVLDVGLGDIHPRPRHLHGALQLSPGQGAFEGDLELLPGVGQPAGQQVPAAEQVHASQVPLRQQVVGGPVPHLAAPDQILPAQLVEPGAEEIGVHGASRGRLPLGPGPEVHPLHLVGIAPHVGLVERGEVAAGDPLLVLGEPARRALDRQAGPRFPAQLALGEAAAVGVEVGVGVLREAVECLQGCPGGDEGSGEAGAGHGRPALERGQSPGPQAEAEVSDSLLPGRAGEDVNHPAHGLAAVECGVRPPHHLDPVDVGNWQLGEIDHSTRTADHALAVDEDQDAPGVDALDHDAGGRSQVSVQRGVNVEAGHVFQERGDVLRPGQLDRFPGEDRHRNGQLRGGLLPAGGGDQRRRLLKGPHLEGEVEPQGLPRAQSHLPAAGDVPDPSGLDLVAARRQRHFVAPQGIGDRSLSRGYRDTGLREGVPGIGVDNHPLYLGSAQTGRCQECSGQPQAHPQAEPQRPPVPRNPPALQVWPARGIQSDPCSRRESFDGPVSGHYVPGRGQKSPNTSGPDEPVRNVSGVRSRRAIGEVLAGAANSLFYTCAISPAACFGTETRV